MDERIYRCQSEKLVNNGLPANEGEVENIKWRYGACLWGEGRGVVNQIRGRNRQRNERRKGKERKGKQVKKTV